MKQQSLFITVLLLLISVFCWGSVFPLSKVVLEHMSQNSLVVWRFSIAACCLLLYLLVKADPWPKLSLPRYIGLIVISLLGVGGFNLLLFTGIKQTTATNGALVMALSPLVTLLMVSAWSRKWLSKVQVLSLLIGLAGVLLVITKGCWQALVQFDFNQGDITVITAMLLWSAYTTASQKMSLWLPVLPFTLLSMLSGDAFILTANALQGEVHPVTELLHLSLNELLAMVYIGVFGTVVGYLFFLNGVQKLGSASAALFFNLIPVFAALTAVMMGQQVTLIQLTGMLIVILGLILPQLLKLVRQHFIRQNCQANG
jgi:drug/metabolite transporter (DMT)-like permease